MKTSNESFEASSYLACLVGWWRRVEKDGEREGKELRKQTRLLWLIIRFPCLLDNIMSAKLIKMFQN
jgi:hypothetical protein